MAKTYVPFGKGSLQFTEIVEGSRQFVLDVNVVSGGGSAETDPLAVILLPTTSARNVIQPSGAAIVPFTVKGFASQSAKLTSWQDSTATELSFVAANGTISAPQFYPTSASGYFADQANGIASYMMYRGGSPNNKLVAANAVHVILAMQAAASQTESFIKMYASDGATPFVRFNATAALYGRSAWTINWSSTTSADGTEDVGLARNAAGVLRVTNGSSGAATLYVGQLGVGASPSINSSVDIQGGVNAVSGAAYGTYARSTLVATANSDVLRGIYINPTFTGGAFTGLTMRGLQIDAGNAAAVPLVLKGAVSQTGNYLDILNSSDVSVLSYSSAGVFSAGFYRVTGSSGNFQTSDGSSYVLLRSASPNNLLIAANAAHVPLVVRGASGQSVDVLQVQNASLATLMVVSNEGRVTIKANDANNTSINPALTLGHNLVSGTAGGGMGTSVIFQAKSDTTADTQIGRIAFAYAVATHASRTVDGNLYATDSAGERTIMSWQADGAAPRVGFLGATPIARTTMGAATAGAVYTATEQAMLQTLWDLARNLGFGT